jgi:hypothetical protein
VAAVAATIRQALEDQPQAFVIANCDDPVVVATAEGLVRVVWVAGGANWLGDAALCPRCGQPLVREGQEWSCATCGLRRPEAHWRFTDGVVHGPETTVPLVLRLPGAHNRGNATAAMAAAAVLGIDPASVAGAIAVIPSVAHRYAVVERGPRRLTLLLAKNPAGWRETLPLLTKADGLLLAVNAREADGRDTSWLWDIPFEELPPLPTVVTGEAAPDLGVRLSYADMAHDTVVNPVAALESLPAGDIAVVANYSAFTRLWHILDDRAQT